MAGRDPDVVVVGAGPNGLVAAVVLARAGLEVLVLEANDTVGGAVRTIETTLPGFRHDPFSAFYPFGVVGPVSKLSLGEHGLTWLHHPRPYGGATPAGRGVAQVRGDLEATAAIFERSQTGDGDGWRELDRWWAWAGEALLSLLFNPLGHVAPAVAGLSLLRNPRRLLEFAQLMAGSAEATATRFFEGEDARSWLSGSVLHGMTDRPAPGSDQASILPRWAYTPRDGDDCAGRRRHPTRWVYCGP